MSRSRLVVAAASVAVIVLAVGYGISGGFDRSPDPPGGPIELDGPLPAPSTPRSDPASVTSATPPVVVPPPTLGPTTSRPQPVNVAPTPAAAPTSQAPTATAPPPAPPPVDDDDDDDDTVGVDAVAPERDGDDVANSVGDDDDDADDGDDD
jgi:hypothetical protein